MNIILAVTAIVVICALAFYTGMLINRIKVQKLQRQALIQAQEKEKQNKIDERNNNIVESIRFIAKATMQKQCNVSEAAIRLSVLLETLTLPTALDIAATYPALTAMFEKVKDMPTHDERKKRPVKEIKMLDIQREVYEAKMEAAILAESALLAEFKI